MRIILTRCDDLLKEKEGMAGIQGNMVPTDDIEMEHKDDNNYQELINRLGWVILG